MPLVTASESGEGQAESLLAKGGRCSAGAYRVDELNALERAARESDSLVSVIDAVFSVRE